MICLVLGSKTEWCKTFFDEYICWYFYDFEVEILSACIVIRVVHVLK